MVSMRLEAICVKNTVDKKRKQINSRGVFYLSFK